MEMEPKPDYPIANFETELKFDGKYSFKIIIPVDIIRTMELKKGDRVKIRLQKQEGSE